MDRLHCEEWQLLPPERVTPLYASEISRWSSQLDWDTTRNWAQVEEGRRLGTVPGFVVTDDTGRVTGWSYGVVHRKTLQVGHFASSSEAATALMLDALLSPERLGQAEVVTGFSFGDAPGLLNGFRRRGLTVDRYWYLGRATRPVGVAGDLGARLWKPGDLLPTANLLAAAYGAPDPARPFVPRSEPESWVEYVSQLTAQDGCGTLLPQACFVIPAGPDRLRAAVLVTQLGPQAGHIAQLAVDPQMQGRRLGRLLLDFASNAAANLGIRRMTLLVGGRNTRARRLYDSAGFEPAGSFIAAGMFVQPRRSTSVAPGAIAVMTRR